LPAGGTGRTPADPAIELDAWLADARACNAPSIATFAAGLEMDGAAVRAAVTQPWSSGQAEGQINRIKLLKRQSYGRASFDLLRLSTAAEIWFSRKHGAEWACTMPAFRA